MPEGANFHEQESLKMTLNITLT